MLLEFTKAVSGTLCLLAIWIAVEPWRKRQGLAPSATGDQSSCLGCLGCTHQAKCSRQETVDERQ